MVTFYFECIAHGQWRTHTEFSTARSSGLYSQSPLPATPHASHIPQIRDLSTSSFFSKSLIPTSPVCQAHSSEQSSEQPVHISCMCCKLQNRSQHNSFCLDSVILCYPRHKIIQPSVFEGGFYFTLFTTSHRTYGFAKLLS